MRNLKITRQIDDFIRKQCYSKIRQNEFPNISDGFLPPSLDIGLRNYLLSLAFWVKNAIQIMLDAFLFPSLK